MADLNKPRRGQGVTRAELAAHRAAGLKRCFRCRDVKEIAAFAADKGRPDGRQPRCRDCTAMAKSEWKSSRDLRQADKGEPRVCAGCSETKPADKFRAYIIPSGVRSKFCVACEASHLASRAEAEARRKTAWLDAHPEHKASYWKSRNALERKAGRLTPADVASLFKLHRGRCANPACRASLANGYHLDHIMPLALGGTTERKNVQPLCAPCNRRKSAKHPVVFAQENGLLV